MIRILIADDQDLIRTGFRLFLGTVEGLEVVGEAADGHDGGARSPASWRPTSS